MMRRHAALEAIWYRPGDQVRGRPLFRLLRILSLPYEAAIRVRNRLYDRGVLPRIRIDRPVVSVGNVTVGGTGKTPFVMLVAKLLLEAGHRPAILSRGFGGRPARPVLVVSDGDRVLAGPEAAGDEPVLMARTLPTVPVLTGPDRAKTGTAAIDRFGASVLVLDDAFQHRRLARDLDIVLTDIRLPFGNGFLLPAGPLREPAGSLDRAQIVVRTGSEAEVRRAPAVASELRGYRRPCALVRGDGRERHPATALSGKQVLAFAGLGRPDDFRKTLRGLGAEVKVFLPFADHCPYRGADVEAISGKAAAAAVDLIVTTEKDAVRLGRYPEFLQRVFQLRIEMDILPSRERLAALMLERIAPCR